MLFVGISCTDHNHFSSNNETQAFKLNFKNFEICLYITLSCSCNSRANSDIARFGITAQNATVWIVIVYHVI